MKRLAPGSRIVRADGRHMEIQAVTDADGIRVVHWLQVDDLRVQQRRFLGRPVSRHFEMRKPEAATRMLDLAQPAVRDLVHVEAHVGLRVPGRQTNLPQRHSAEPTP